MMHTMTKASADSLIPETVSCRSSGSVVNRRLIGQGKISKIRKRYNLTPEEVCKIFFSYEAS